VHNHLSFTLVKTVSSCFPKRNLIPIGLLLAAACLNPLRSAAATDSLPNFDQRLGPVKTSQLAVVVNTAKENAASVIRNRVKDVRIDSDEILGSPKFVGSTREFLTGPNGSGGAVSAATGAAFPANDPHRGVKMFLTEHQALFGFGPEALAAAKVNKDYVSAPGNFRTVVWQQQVDDIPVFEGILKAHLTKNGELINVGSQFVAGLPAALGKIANRLSMQTNPPVSTHRAIVLAAENIGHVLTTNQIAAQDAPQGNQKFQHFRGFPILNNTSARLTWLPVDSSTLRLCWDISLESRARGELYRVLVDAVTGKVWLRQCLTENLSAIQMNVWTGESPSPLSPSLSTVSSFQPAVVARTLVNYSSLDPVASPLGWINDGDNTTAGNNVDAHLDWDNNNIADPNSRAVGSPFRVFNFPIDLTTQQPRDYTNAAVVSLFYWNNWAHDKYYELGFTEAAGNFQNERFGRGGYPGTAVQADGQDSYALVASGTTRNNANFSTPADGSSPRMQMYIYPGPNPNRDADLDASIMLHEYTHGVSSRLVGGGVGISSLQTAGMGEGWSDFCSMSLLSNPANDPDANYVYSAYVSMQWVLTDYLSNYYFGGRRYPYTTDMTKNPLTFKDIDVNQISAHAGVPINPVYPHLIAPADEVHNVGEVWCVTLWEARSRLCQKYGNAAGNQTMLQLVLDGMKLANANPSFVDARNAILQADLNLSGGANLNDLWIAFAKRGLGNSATAPPSSTTTGVVEAFDLPPESPYPTVSVISPTEEGSYSSPPTVSGSSDISTGQVWVKLARVSDGLFYNPTNGTWGAGAAVMVANGVATWNLTLPALADGLYQLIVNVEDGSFLSGTIHRNFTIDTSTPQLTISSPIEGALFASPPMVTGGVTDSSLVQKVAVILARGTDGAWYNFASNAWGTAVFDANRNVQFATVVQTSWTATLPPLADGSYQVEAQAIDHAGNTTAWNIRHFVMDATPPVVTINSPTNGIYKVAPTASGTAADSNGLIDSGVVEVQVEMYRTSDKVWWNFHDNTWGTINYNAFYNLRVATGTASWSAALPASLADGGYQVRAQAVDGAANTSGWVTRNFTIDNTAPTITFSPLVSQQVVFNFDQLGGTVNKTSAVQFTIERFQADGNMFWTGGSWTSVAGDPGALFSANLSGLNWTPAPGTLPGRRDLAQATYVIHVYATDTAGNNGDNTLVLSRSALDTTPPIVNLDPTSIHPGEVFTNRFLPLVWGLAYDYESGVASMSALLARNTGSGPLLYWDGSSWTSTPTDLPVTYSAQDISWHLNVALPSGANLPNAMYTLDVSAANNEVPSMTGLLNLNFTVDYHPVFTFTAGSYLGGYTGNVDMRWENPGNWDVGTVPTADARVVITNYTPDNTHSGSLMLYRLDLSGGTLTTAGMLITNLNVSGGALSGGVISLPANGVFNWSGGILAGDYNVPVGATVNLTGSADKMLNLATLVNNGTVIWNGGNLLGSYGSVVNNNATFVLQSSGFLYNYTGGSPSPIFNNNGLLQKTTSNGDTIVAPDNGGWTFNQNGTIDVENGALNSQSQFNVNGGAVFAGPGVTRVDAGTILINGTNTIQAGGTVELAGGVLDGNGAFGGTGTFNWTGGTIAGAILNLASTLSFNLSGDNDKTLGAHNYGAGVLTSAGPVIWTGAGHLNIGGYGSAWINGGTFTVQTDAQVLNTSDGGAGPMFVNNGTFLTASGYSTAFTNIPGFGTVAFNNNGILSVQGGVISLDGGGAGNNGTFMTVAGSRIDLAGGRFDLGGNSTFSGLGTIRVAGDIVVLGVSNMLGGGTFEVAGGVLAGNGAFGGTGTFNWTGGAIAGAILNFASTLSFNLSGDNDKTLGAHDYGAGDLTTAGPVIWTGAGHLNVGGYGSAWINGGTFTVQTDAQVLNTSDGGAGPVFVNNGTFVTASGYSTAFTNIPGFGTVAFNNNATVSAQGGVISLGGGGAGNNGTYTTVVGSRIDLVGGRFDLSGNSTFNGLGTIRVLGDAVVLGVSNTLGGGTFEMAGGVLAGNGAFGGTGTFNWTGGAIAGAILNLASTLSFNLSGDNDKTLGTHDYGAGDLTSAGVVTWTGAGHLNIGGYGSAWINGGTFTVQTDAQVLNTSDGGASPVFVNNGTFLTVSGYSTAFTNTPGFGAVAFNNNGTMSAQGGVISLGGGGAGNNGTFATVAGSRIDLVGGRFALNGNSTLSGLGTVRVLGDVVVLEGPITLGGSIFEVAGGVLEGTSAFGGAGTFNWTGGAIAAATLNLASTLSFNLSGNNDKTMGTHSEGSGVLTSAGPVTWTGTGNLKVSGGSAWNNDGIFTVQTDAQVISSSDGGAWPVFVNNGTFRKKVTTGTTVFDSANGGVNFNNNGTVDLQTGSLAINGGYILSGSPQLKLVLGGVNPGTQFSQETFAGSATLGGILSVTLANGFMPTNGQSFAVVTYGSETGQFGSQQLPALPIGLAWQITYGATAVTLNVVRATIIADATRLANGHFQFSLSGPNSTSALIQASTNLVDWTSLQTNIPFTGLLLFDDAQAVGYRVRFYRVLLQP
jgi:hypothetical protein